jgi:hypothetical protein
MIDFKSFLSEELVESTEESVGYYDYEELNNCLFRDLSSPFLSVQAGFSFLRKTLFSYGIDIPPVFDLDPDGDEMLLDVSGYGAQQTSLLYVLYSLTDDGYYEFYAELTDEAGADELLKSGTEEQQEEV